MSCHAGSQASNLIARHSTCDQLAFNFRSCDPRSDKKEKNTYKDTDGHAELVPTAKGAQGWIGTRGVCKTRPRDVVLRLGDFAYTPSQLNAQSAIDKIYKGREYLAFKKWEGIIFILLLE